MPMLQQRGKKEALRATHRRKRERVEFERERELDTFFRTRGKGKGDISTSPQTAVRRGERNRSIEEKNGFYEKEKMTPQYGQETPISSTKGGGRSLEQKGGEGGVDPCVFREGRG